jgi:hypothetical protein
MPKTNSSSGSSRPRGNPPGPDEDFTDADFEEILAASKRELSERLEQHGIYRDLGAEQRNRLADLVGRFSVAYNLWEKYPHSAKLLRADERNGNTQRKRFKNKINDAVMAVDAALKYAGKVGGGARPNEIFARILRSFATPFLQDAKKALESIPLLWGNFTKPSSGSGFHDPKQEARVALMEFFVADCRFTKSEASVRTGKIGNVFLGWDIDLEDQHESANPKRARAVLKTYSRMMKSRQTKRR